MADRIGALREQLQLQTRVPPVIPVVSITRAGTTATIVTEVPHQWLPGDFILIAGATPTAYNGKTAVTVIDPLTVTFLARGSPATPATGTITALYLSDALGGRRPFWQTFDTMPAELQPIAMVKRLQAEATRPGNYYQFGVRIRPDLDQTMRALWTPIWPPGAPTHTLEITQVRPDADDYDPSVQYRFLVLDCFEITVVPAI